MLTETEMQELESLRSLKKLDCPDDCVGCEYERDRMQMLEEKLLEND